MKILLTGGTGFIGSHVIDQLLATGAEVVGLRRPRPCGDGPCDRQDVAWRDCSLDDAVMLRAIFREARPDVCLHMAWLTEKTSYPYSSQNLELLAASLCLLRAAAEEGCPRFVGVGTCAEYESSFGLLHEDNRTNPSTLYGASKLALRHLGESLARQSGMEFSWGRVFYVYGPREDRRRVVPAVINTLLDGEPFAATTGEQVRDFLHVADVASAFITICKSQEVGVFNVSSGELTTMRSLLTEIARSMGFFDNIRFGAATKQTFDPPCIVGDCHRLRTLGWKPQFTLTSGLANTIEWWRRYRETGRAANTPRTQ